jgi:hypothetical protein
MSTKEEKQIADDNARAKLRVWCEAAIAAGEVYANTIVGRSGMSALVQLAVIKDGRLVTLWPCDSGYGDWEAAQERQRKALGFNYARRGIVVGGCGFNREVHALETVFRVAGLKFDQRAVRVSSAF